MERSVFSDEAALAVFCERSGIRRLSLFGGAAREDSDVEYRFHARAMLKLSKASFARDVRMVATRSR